MNFITLVLVANFSACYISCIFAQDVYLNVTFEEFVLKCQESELNYKDVLKEAREALDGLFSQLVLKSVDETNEISDLTLTEMVNKHCLVADTKLLITKLLDAALLCFNENDRPSSNEIQSIVNKSLTIFCSSRLLTAVFYIVYSDCYEKSEVTFIKCLKDPQDILSSPLVDLLYPLAIRYSKKQCEFTLKQIDCFNNIVKQNCESAVARQQYIIMNNMIHKIGCSLK